MIASHSAAAAYHGPAMALRLPSAAPGAPAELVNRVRETLAASGSTDVEAAVLAASDAITDDTVLAAIRRQVSAELTGAGPLEPLLALAGVTDVLVTGPDAVWIDRGSGVERVPVHFADESAVRRLAQRLVAASGSRLDDAQPYADAALPDGTRLHAVIPPLVPATTLSLRVLARTSLSLDDLTSGAALGPDVAEVLRAVVAARLTFVLSGGTGTGKTTMLAALLGEVAATDRVLVIEDVRELSIAHPHVVRLATRAENIEGAGEIGPRELVRQALRMRPDRLVVGEFRGPEMVELLIALNTGHEGGAATVHANSARDVPRRLAVLGALGGVPASVVTDLAANAIHVIVHLGRDRDGQRRVEQIAVPDRGTGAVDTATVWSRSAGVGAGAAVLSRAVEERGVPTPELLR
jgi:pilus assembly protein CpaF